MVKSSTTPLYETTTNNLIMEFRGDEGETEEDALLIESVDSQLNEIIAYQQGLQKKVANLKGNKTDEQLNEDFKLHHLKLRRDIAVALRKVSVLFQKLLNRVYSTVKNFHYIKKN